MKRRVILAILITITSLASAARAEVSKATRERIAALQLDLKKASSLFLSDDFKQSGETIERIQAVVQELAKAGDKETLAALKPLHDSLGRAHAALEIKGVKMAALPPLGATEPGKPTEPLPPGAVGFTKHVAPILMGKCGACHVRNARGMFSMANYESLMEGNENGKVLIAGDAKNSRLIEKLESGDMPRGGLKISPAEQATLAKWIDAGAKFDGPNPRANLSVLAPNVSSALPKVELLRATGKETVSYASDIAPLLNEHCANCHGNGRRPSGRFNLTNMTAMLRGGDSGPPFIAGKAEESLVIQKLVGPKSGERMPRRKPPLPEEAIAKIRTWINEGAPFDGPDPAQHVEQVAALASAQAASHEELSQTRVELALKNWKLGMADIEAGSAETDNFFVLGNFGEAAVAEFAKKAEAVAPKVAEMFGAPSGKPLFQRYDYSEFGKMVERRDLPRPWRGHWRFNQVDAYGAMIPPRADEYAFDPLVTEFIAGAYIKSLGNVPDWFASGAGRTAASRAGADDSRVAQWEQQLPEVLAGMQASDDFITGKMPPDTAAIASHSFVKYLMGRDSKRFKQLLGAIRDGDSFDEAFTNIYRTSPTKLSSAWSSSISRKTKKKRR